MNKQDIKQIIKEWEQQMNQLESEKLVQVSIVTITKDQVVADLQLMFKPGQVERYSKLKYPLQKIQEEITLKKYDMANS